MYEIAYELLYEDVYENFIIEAVKRSEYVSFDVYWPGEDFVFFPKKDFLNAGLSEAFYNSRYKHELKKYKMEKEIFQTECLGFLDELNDYLVGVSTFSRDIVNYKLYSKEELMPILQKPKSLNGWGFPRYPDNLSFIVNNKPWFVCTNHGQSNAMIRVESKHDYDFWKEMGVFFLENYNDS